MTTYVLAGGCFWCLDAIFRQLQGVESSVSGYAGGNAEDASYSRVASGMTNHAEAVEITFDESVTPPETLLDIFFLLHDPTTKDRQGNDIGRQYRSVMFYADDVQKQAFETAKQRAKQHWDAPVVTTIEPLDEFYPAEPEHQDYFANNPANPYCSFVIQPKVIKARQAYTHWFKED